MISPRRHYPNLGKNYQYYGRCNYLLFYIVMIHYNDDLLVRN